MHWETKKFTCLALLQDSLYCSSLELNPQVSLRYYCTDSWYIMLNQRNHQEPQKVTLYDSVYVRCAQ